MASLMSNKLRTLLLNHGIDLLSDTIKVMLVNNTYTPDKDHSFVDSITGGSSKELTGTGYTGGFSGSGRKTLASKTVTQDDTNDKGVFDAADVTWTGINAGTVGFIVVIKEITNDAASPILAVIDVTPDVVTNGGDYTAQWATDGLFHLA
jgi:hypothetical protein